MQQQSKSLHGCRRNPWPTFGEKAVLARRLGVRIRRQPPSLALDRRIGQISPRQTRDEVIARVGKPTGRRRGRLTFEQDALDVRLVDGRVGEVATRSTRYRTPAGIRVAISLSKLQRLLPDLRCGDYFCVDDQPRRARDSFTVFHVSGPRVDEISIRGALPTNRPLPETEIVAGPTGVTDDRRPTLVFSSKDDLVSFECRIDGVPFRACRSPYTAPQLGDGAHTFEARAVDVTGRRDATPASRTFTVAQPPRKNGPPLAAGAAVPRPARGGAGRLALSARVSTPRLVGRDAELDAVEQALDAVDAGPARALGVLGEPGRFT